MFCGLLSLLKIPADCARYYTQKRLGRASKKLGIPELTVYDQFEDRRVGLRFCTFVRTAAWVCACAPSPLMCGTWGMV